MICDHDAAYWAEDAKIEFAVAVERRMEALGLSRRGLADAIESSPAYITKLLRGDANLTIESMAKVSHALGARLHIHIAPEESSVRWLEVLPVSKEPVAAKAWLQRFQHASETNQVALYA